MDISLSVLDGLHQIYDLQDTIRRQRRVNRTTYLRMMEIYVELQMSESFEWDATLQRTKAIERFSAAVGMFAVYLKKYHDMHWHGRIFKHARMEEERLNIVDEFDNLARMMNLASTAVTNTPAATATNAERLFAKLENMHGDIRFTHDEIHEALLAGKHQIILMRTKEMPESEPVARQHPILKRYSVVHEAFAKDDTSFKKKSPINEMKQARRGPVLDEEKVNIEEKQPTLENTTSAELEDKAPIPVVEATQDEIKKQAVLEIPMREQDAYSAEDSSVSLLIQLLGAVQGTPQQKEEALLGLLCKCVTNSNRVQVYKTKGIPVFKDLVRNSDSFFTQLYALHCLSWITFSYSKLPESEFVELQNCVRQPTHPEIVSLLHQLQHEDDDVKEVAVLQCSCLATRGDGDALRRVGVLPPVIELLKNGTSNQKLWAAETLVTLAGDDDDENSEAIIREGGIPVLVSLLRSGTDMQKQEAAYALGNLASNDVNRSKIAREGAIPPMVAFVKAVTGAQNQWAVYALGRLSVNNEENRVLIAQEGAIPPLVTLLRTGTHAQKEWAAYALGNLSNNYDNRVKITQEGAITLLVELLRTGTAMAKQRATFALGNLACDSEDTADFDEAILPLVELVRSGSESQKEDAAYTLGNLACSNDHRRTEIGRKGAIPPLVKLLEKGSDDQKEWAAFALRYLAYDNAVNRVNIVNEGAMPLLVAMTEEGTDDQKEQAGHALKYFVAKDEAYPQGFTPVRLMNYIRAEAPFPNMTEIGMVREKITPIFHRLASDSLTYREVLLTDEGQNVIMVNHTKEPSMYRPMFRDGNSIEVTKEKMFYDTQAFFDGIKPYSQKNLKSKRPSEKDTGLEIDAHGVPDSITSFTSVSKQTARIYEETLESSAEFNGQFGVPFATLAEMCMQMEETQDMCKRVLDRLRLIQKLIIQKNDVISRREFVVIRKCFCTFLMKYKQQTAFNRLVSSRTIVDLLSNFHVIIDSLKTHFLQDAIDLELNWVEPWEQGKQKVEKDLIQLWETNSVRILALLSDRIAQENALLLLAHEKTSNQHICSVAATKLLSSMTQDIIRHSAIPVPPVPGWFIPDHEVQREQYHFARGSLGKVYRGTWRNKKVVIKCVNVESVSDERDFSREARIRLRTQHPNVVRFFGACHLTRPCFFVYEDVTNGNLAKFLTKTKESDRALTWRLLHDAALGLQFLHQNNIVHGNVRCKQILVTEDLTAKLTDFGMKFMSIKSMSTKAVSWKAPELLTNESNVSTFASDVYSFGICVVEAVCGSVPGQAHQPDSSNTLISRPIEFVNDNQWEFVRSLCSFEPSERLSLSAAIEKIKIFVLQEDQTKITNVTSIREKYSCIADDETQNEVISERSSPHLKSNLMQAMVSKYDSTCLECGWVTSANDEFCRRCGYYLLTDAVFA